jgi:hypothetical protein
MATKKKATTKKGNLRDLPKSKKEMPSDQAKGVKGGFSDMTVTKNSDAPTSR